MAGQDELLCPPVGKTFDAAGIGRPHIERLVPDPARTPTAGGASATARPSRLGRTAGLCSGHVAVLAYD